MRKPLRLKPRRGVSLPVEQIRLVAVQGLVEQHLSVPGGPGPEHVDRRGEVIECLVPRQVSLTPPLHRADDRRSAELAGDVDDPCDELPRRGPHARVSLAEVTFLRDPTGSGADRRHRQAMLCQQPRELGHRKSLGRLWENLDGVEAEFGRCLADSREPAIGCGRVKHEGPLPGLGHQTDRDSDFHGVMPVCRSAHEEWAEVAIK